MADVAIVSVITSGIVGVASPLIVVYATRKRQIEDFRHTRALKDLEDLRLVLDAAFISATELVESVRATANHVRENSAGDVKDRLSPDLFAAYYRKNAACIDYCLKVRLRLGREHEITRALEVLVAVAEDVAEWHAPSLWIDDVGWRSKAAYSIGKLNEQLNVLLEAGQRVIGARIEGASVAADRPRPDAPSGPLLQEGARSKMRRVLLRQSIAANGDRKAETGS